MPTVVQDPIQVNWTNLMLVKFPNQLTKGYLTSALLLPELSSSLYPKEGRVRNSYPLISEGRKGRICGKGKQSTDVLK